MSVRHSGPSQYKLTRALNTSSWNSTISFMKIPKKPELFFRSFFQLVGDLSELREKDYADLKMTRIQQQAKLQAIAEKKVSKGDFLWWVLIEWYPKDTETLNHSFMYSVVSLLSNIYQFIAMHLFWVGRYLLADYIQTFW